MSEVCNLRKLLVAPVAGSGDIEAFMLPAGLTAVAVHAGAYEQLPETFAALEEWIRTQGRAPAGAPWEVYVTVPDRASRSGRLAHRDLVARQLAGLREEQRSGRKH